MQSNRHFLTTAALVVVAMFMLDVPAAQAIDKFFYNGGTPGNWSADANWWSDRNHTTSTTKPLNGDTAIILTGETCNVDITNGRADGFQVEGTGLLNIQAGKLLEIDSNSTIVPSSGVILEGAASELKISATLTISGDGSLEGKSNTALITIADGLTFTSETTIKGQLQIVQVAGGGTTRFINATNGLVHANVAGTIDLNVDALDDGTNRSPGNWQVSNASAFLKFSTAGTLLSGNFTVSAGILDINENVTTTGDLDFTGGKIDVESGDTFQAEPEN
jgi:hypothetical protein